MWDSIGFCIYKHIYWTVYVMSNLVKVIYSRATTNLKYRDRSLYTCLECALSLGLYVSTKSKTRLARRHIRTLKNLISIFRLR